MNVPVESGDKKAAPFGELWRPFPCWFSPPWYRQGFHPAAHRIKRIVLLKSIRKNKREIIFEENRYTEVQPKGRRNGKGYGKRETDF
jgi:hypothetical protein